MQPLSGKQGDLWNVSSSFVVPLVSQRQHESADAAAGFCVALLCSRFFLCIYTLARHMPKLGCLLLQKQVPDDL